MELDLKFCRFESAPWGFRLIGGADFEFPLTVVKVVEGGLANQAGLQVDDVIVRINNEPTSNLTHDEVHQLIGHCGNNFFVTVYREEPFEQNNNNENESGTETAIQVIQDEFNKIVEEEVPEETIQETEYQQQSIQLENDPKTDDFPEEEKIAEMISAEAEILKEHNVIGVNFNRIFPKSGICQSSEVFRTLNEEAIKTRAEMEKEKRKWTTFLQKPDRPIPKTKAQIELEKRELYRVQIIKQSKPRIAPDFVPDPNEVKEEEKRKNEEPEEKLEEPPKEEEEEERCPSPKESEMPNLEQIDGTQNEDQTTKYGLDVVPEEAEETVESEQTAAEETGAGEAISEQTGEEQRVENEEKPQDFVDEAVERQLSEIQKQLKALAVLPSTIQATLDAVTRQLSELIPNVKIEEVSSGEVKTTDECNGEAEITITNEDIEGIDSNGIVEEPAEKGDEDKIEETRYEQIYTQQMIEEEFIEKHTEYSARSEEQSETVEYSFESERKIQHSEEKVDIATQKGLVLTELQQKQRMLEERMSKRPSKTVTFGGLTPQERPLVLPGGRRWRQPKDAYNDEFIAEVLSSQAELITGQTLGVNFLKYKKPEKHIDLEKSEVYKVIHNLDRVPKCGIELRPPKVAAAADIRGVSP